MIGTLGEAPESTVWSRTVADVDRLEVKDPERVSYLTQTTLSLDETQEIVTRLRERFPEIRAQRAGYLLCHRKPAVGREGGGAAVPGAAGGGVAEQLEFAPAGGGLREEGVPAYLIDDLSEVKPRMAGNASEPSR